jgi:tRNA wybutosine-synthesizing protein 1
MVTNAQFPKKIETLEPVTQLYVSVDAATKDALQAVDQPLFKDFWPRTIDSLKAMHDKRVRTVYRLTLVKGSNMDDLGEWAKLVALGWPCFIEIKGVTFCGSANGNEMTMEKVPFHEEVRDFCLQLCELLDGKYDVACEHEHSNCVLIADVEKYKIDGKWMTHIDYDRFHELVAQYYEDGTPFGAEDYTAETPPWAVFDSKEKGFDPDETRFRKKRNHPGKEKKEGKVAEETKT